MKQQAGKDVMMRMAALRGKKVATDDEQSRAGSFCRLSRNLPKTGGGMHAWATDASDGKSISR